MRRLITLLSVACLGVHSLVGHAEMAPQPALPLTKIVLYSSGVGYFQRDGQIDGHGEVPLRFKVDNVNDLLKSMIVQDFDGGQVTTVTYDSRDPLTKALKSFAVDLTQNPSLGNLLWQLRGELVEVSTPNPVRGTILGVETKQERVSDKEMADVEYLNLLTDSGLRAIALPQVQEIQIANARLNAELRQALTVLASSHDTQKKTVLLAFNGTGQRRVRVAYIVETPVWKTSYRLVLSDTDKPFLQGWALVENTTDEDWRDVQLSLMSGRPISFTMDMYEPLYAQRPVVVPELYAALRPQVYGQTMEGPESQAASRADDEEARKSGSKRAEARRDAPASPTPPPATRSALAQPGAAAEPASQLPLDQGVTAAAQAAEVGELFEYAITAPVSLARQKSAMLPIVNDSVAGTKLSIYNQRVHAKHPLHGFRLQNATALHLLQGPITVFDGGSYAGDARLDDLPPGQERLISYALDLKTEVEPLADAEQRELVTVSLRKGTLIATQKVIADKGYNVKNRDQKSKQVLIEHPFRPDWKLAAPSTAAERTREVYRFPLSLDAGKTAQLRVREEKDLQQSIALTDAGPDTMAYYLRATQVSPKVKEALQRIVSLRERLDQTVQQRRRLEQRVQEITQEQTRIRDNMGKLAQNAELYTRYVRKLDQQETEIDKLRQELEALKTTEEEQRKGLSAYLLGLEIS